MTITGDHLSKVTSVKFGLGGWSGHAAGLEAASFQVVSDTRIDAVVPPGSRWGSIQVTTPGGTADTTAVMPVNYFWPDNLHIASGNNMYPVGDGGGAEAYRLFRNEYNSSAPFVMDSDNGAGYRISHSDIDSTVNWVKRQNGVGAYPAVFTGKHWQQGTPVGTNGLPVQLSAIRGGGVLTSSFTADLSQVRGGKWNAAYDMFLSTTSDGANSYEIMVWLHRVNCQPIGSIQAAVTIDGQNFDVWHGGHTVSFVANPLKTGPNATLHIDVGKLINDAISREYFPESWWLTDIEAGFEIWHGCANLVARHFEVKRASP